MTPKHYNNMKYDLKRDFEYFVLTNTGFQFKAFTYDAVRKVYDERAHGAIYGYLPNGRKVFIAEK